MWNLLEKVPEFQNLIENFANGQTAKIYGLLDSQKSFYLAGLQRLGGYPQLILVPNLETGQNLKEDLEQFSPGVPVYYFPPYFGSMRRAENPEVTAQRLNVLEKLVLKESLIVVAPVEAAVDILVPPEVMREELYFLMPGTVLNWQVFLQDLARWGYERVDMVEGKGQFSVRGGIIDIFPPAHDLPVRVDLFGDTVHALRGFEPGWQRSTGELKQVWIGPAEEIVIRQDVAGKALQRLTKEWPRLNRRFRTQGSREEIRRAKESWLRHRENLQEGVYYPEVEQIRAFLYPERVTLVDYLPPEGLLCLDEPAKLREMLKRLTEKRSQNRHHWVDILHRLQSPYLSEEEFWEQLRGKRVAAFSLLPRQVEKIDFHNIIKFSAKSVPSFLGKLEIFLHELRRWQKAGLTLLILASTPQRAESVKNFLKQQQIDYIEAERLPDRLVPGRITITVGSLYAGFQLTQPSLVVVTDQEIFGRRKEPLRPVEKNKRGLDDVSALIVGDYVVHVNHGVGRYLGLKKLEAGGTTKDYVWLQYAGEDRLYVPVEQLHLLQKYIGAEDHVPKLNRLNGADWTRVKKRVKKSLRETAEELIELNAAREQAKGYAFSPDTVWQQEFEDAFPYEETPDQQECIKEVKADMMQVKPMDRLLCGDVGFGKTEVALRAAFKAVMDGKQVVVLVPTTILAQQHFYTFKERFSRYPVNIGFLSRFKSRKEQKEIIARIQLGQTDIVIGTHRLLSEDVQFYDLGLLVIDEEQRFGVRHKEKIKRLKYNVDVLTLTATPIPRTLHMALSGVRDLSLIETPPENRYPIQTYVIEFSPEIVLEAVRRELERGGQVFYVHNRIDTIDKKKEFLKGLLPEAEVAVAHGQMPENNLERVMLDFLERRYDILVCTTIIENGLDLSNVNTLIIEQADRLGLAQLYQLRGRIGRGNRVAYAYFTFEPDFVLTETAEKRLNAIRDFTEFGSGFKIALRDLEIRGAGNILGPEQHGHLVAVGFEMYCRLLEETIAELKGKKSPEDWEKIPEQPLFDLKVNAHLPEVYIPDNRSKIEIYKRIIEAKSPVEVDEIEAELNDRFGILPAPAQNLLNLRRLKILSVKTGVESVQYERYWLKIKFKGDFRLRGEDKLRLFSYQGVNLSSYAGGFEMRINTSEIQVDELFVLLYRLLETLKNI